ASGLGELAVHHVQAPGREITVAQVRVRSRLVWRWHPVWTSLVRVDPQRAIEFRIDLERHFLGARQLGGHQLGLVVRVDRDEVARSALARVRAANRLDPARALAIEPAIGERSIPGQGTLRPSDWRAVRQKLLELQVNAEDSTQLEPTDEHFVGGVS